MPGLFRRSSKTAAAPAAADAPPVPGAWPTLRLLLVITLGALVIGWHALVYPLTGWGGWGLRYLIFPALIVFAMLRSGGKFVQALYDFREFNTGFTHLMAAMFGQSYPTATISEGKIQGIKPDEDHIISTAGGPGYVVVQPDSAALVEATDGRVRVLKPGRPYLTRWETIKEVFNLEERTARVDRIQATSKDGIEIWARDVRYRYRLLHDAADELGGPQRFSEQAVINAVYFGNITGAGLATWHSVVNGAVEGVIQDHIRKHTLDQLTAPKSPSDDPRGAMYKRLTGDEGRNQLKARGAELLWIDIGHFEAAKHEVADRRIETWRAPWQGKAKVARAVGEGKLAAFKEIGRAEAQAEVLLNLIRVLEETAQEGKLEQSRRALYLARIAQLLEGRSRQLALPEDTEK